MTHKDVTTLKDVHSVLKGAGLWGGVKRFVKSNNNLILPGYLSYSEV